MWLCVVFLAGPIAAALGLLSRWIEFSHVGVRPNAHSEPQPEYDDPFLRANHPFWEGHPPAEVTTGQYKWRPPRLKDLPPVDRFIR